MMSHRLKRQVLFFLAAVLLPCLMLVALSLRMMRQERELSEKRAAEERSRVTREIRQDLQSRLERIRLEEITRLAAGNGAALNTNSPRPLVVMVGMVAENRLVFPWEADTTAKESRRALSEAEFAGRIREAESQELGAKQFDRAAGIYLDAADRARNPVQSAFARLLLARVLFKADRRSDSLAHYRNLLQLTSRPTDEHGVPLALYAANSLVGEGLEYDSVLTCIRIENEARPWLSPAEAYLMAELLVRILRKSSDSKLLATAGNLQNRILERTSLIEQALALQAEFPSLLLAHRGESKPNSTEAVWVAFGKPLWLVALPPPSASPRTVVAVAAPEVFATLNAIANPPERLGAIQFVTGAESKGEPLGPGFPGLAIIFSPAEDAVRAGPWSLERLFYPIVLFLVLSVTLSAAYFLWRDVRRETRLAEMRSQFVSSVSHELKTPLTAIRMFAETLRMGRAVAPQTQQEYLDTIVNESERLTRLLNNVLDFSKIEQGQKIYHRELISLPQVVHAAGRAMQYPLAERGFVLQVEIQDNLPAVRADADALEQAILNLLTNAMKYSGDSREIALRLTAQNACAVIQVTDHGVGIPPEETSRIFQKFYRVPSPENQLIPGTGLGLTLVEHVARAHGGQVGVESVLGQGSTFSLRIPLEARS
jgi:signal transduction histidine kinase